ncbi:hypothetical protein DDB_G0280247 [Dictyostelium discoideum AX4]|uniref:THH1/TOM1/TOM3 domain-containing protein n=1 Tax=Dictyostelium discoideum TaxID=44689 RepID=Q54VM6_DICDI|nr:hypothetical protein DDB_G0280247 [Dictyostelium discoideum AX4]EAL67350.1 hypothetical protein DDB_G0280247 [Dictyostelium discoideum AX4]|eukprot:XP_641329.1 hypothetical protein DDB_G0280247 [Dictyostelium discoideum AX4]
MTSYFSGIPFPLLILYSSLTLIVSFQIVRILYNKHNIFSFRFGFLLLGFIWGLLRAIFWGFFDIFSSNKAVLTTFFLIPINIQFATFSLLVLFYAHVVHRTTWERFTRMRFTIVYSSVNIILLVLQIAFYGWKLRIIKQNTNRHLQSQLPLSIIPITFFIFLCFTSRCVYDFIAAFGKVNISLSDQLSLRENLTVFFTYLVWEILPYILILVLFWRIPTTHIGGLARRNKNVNSFAYPPQTAVIPGRIIQQQPSRLFLDPQRYDSDDETTNLLHKGSPVLYSGRHSPYSTTPISGSSE